ncbi:MAG: GDP-mannose 4,6-dehydratase [Armatimonadota bacterium]|nr:GDP-mannose 4,6-dehydratase [Armatimonadota bacterium]MDW8155531.1 GDP-mannose 4,6-dehydratase [Armatimonadota bacterium]
MRVLVTGGAGFIGSHVVAALRQAGHRVAVVDTLEGGRAQFVPPGVPLYRVDVASPQLEEVFQQERPEVVCHHAAQASVAVSVRDPLHDARVNVLGTLQLLECCVRYGVGRVLFASTGGAIYGEPEVVPVSENHPARPLSPYGVHKLCAEHHLAVYGRLHGLRWVSLRYGNVYGPRQDPYGEAGVVAIFCVAMLHGRQPVIFGDGLHTRDYVYVEDVARANRLALEADAAGVFNVGTGVETSTRRIFDLLRQATGYEGEPRYGPPRPGDVRRIALDCTRAEQVLGWRPRVPLEEGIARTVAWFREYGRAGRQDVP